MNEYQRVYDSSADLESVNEQAKEGWRIIATFNDERRGQMFIMERLLAPRESGLPIRIPVDVEKVFSR